MEHHCLSLLLILYGSEIVKGWCYMDWFEPVDCVKGEHCCGSGRAAKCCKEGEPDPIPSVIGITVGVIAGGLLLGGVLYLCKKMCTPR